ncbi:MAG: hypothetical protein L6Q71_00565 [Planctomycetes bacterium]|nr:hypothetical protein [Planctomycetota bacterium]NUQ35417.1 hypothetical protein [Planctomycetaceae bacterium]
MARYLSGVLGIGVLGLAGCQGETSNDALILAHENQRSIERLSEDVQTLKNSIDKLAADKSGYNDDLLRFDALERRISELNNRLNEQAEAAKAAANTAAPSGENVSGAASPDQGVAGAAPADEAMKGAFLKALRAKRNNDGTIIEGEEGVDQDIGALIEKMMAQHREQRNKEMNLDEYTANRLAEIENAYRQKTGEIMSQFADGGITDEQLNTEMESAQKNSQAEIDMLLTPEQKKIYDDHGGLGGGRTTVMTVETGPGAWIPAPKPAGSDDDK